VADSDWVIRLKAFPLAIALALTLPASALANCGAAADRAPGSSLKRADKATLCLLNTERHRHHLRSLRMNRRLALAGERHVRDMVRHDYFAHNARSGQTFVDRIMRTHYVPAASSWFLGENLAWGSRAKATPRQIVRAWMASPGHRHNILQARFREIGIAIVAGAPVHGVRAAATYATEFGVIHRH
jgi:uncharacterized protein YkwD